MLNTLRLVIVGMLAVQPPALAANWADNRESYTQTPEYGQSKTICRTLKGLAPPPADRPDAAASASLRGCRSEALYYGIGMAADAPLARQCAYLERAARGSDQDGFSGSAMLMTIYANGVGAQRNLDLATSFACELDGAPAEMDSRVKHLAALKAKRWTGHDFSLCDDATSGYLGGVCAAHDAAIDDAKRSGQFAALTQGWSGADKAALDKLQHAEKAFADAHASNEVDQSGTLRGAFVTEAQQKQQQDFLDMLRSLTAGTAPAYDAQRYAAADAELNDIYKRVQAHSADDWGTVTKDGIRAAQRVWLRYRDAWVTFAQLKYPSVSSDSIRAWLTEKRIAMLQDFLS